MDTFVLRSVAIFTGSIQSDGDLPQKVIIEGTNLSARVDSVTGTFNFGVIPAGDYRIVAMRKNDASHEYSLTCAGNVLLTEGVEIQKNLVADFTGLSVDDFEGKGSLISDLLTSWYIVKGGDIAVKFPSDRQADTSYIPILSSLVENEAYSGKSLHLNYLAGEGSHFLIVGAEVSTDISGFSFIDTITFSAKGNGHLLVRLHGSEDDDKPQAIFEVKLDTMWQKFTITSDMYTIYDPLDDSASWKNVEYRMKWISFHPGNDGTDFWLDEIRFVGVTIKEFVIP